jgi:hypothetical protein
MIQSSRKVMAMPIGNWDDHYLEVGVQYYIAGRQAAFWHYMVASNLLHHALEMILKAAFRGYMPPDLVRSYGHDLPGLWAHFKTEAGDARLDRFDQLVSHLDPWEDIRYPDFDRVAGKYSTRSITLMIEISRSATKSTAPKNSRDYTVCLEDFDELFALLVEVMHVHPKYLWTTIMQQTADVYRQENRHLISEEAS